MQNKSSHLKNNFKNAKILIAENDNDQWLTIQQAMRQCMSEITAQRISNAEQALTLLEEWRYQELETPKLILLDLYLPTKADGWQLLKQIKTMPYNLSKAPVIMLPSSADGNDIKKAYQLGIAAYMIKPLESDQWLTCFRQFRTYWWETVTLQRFNMTSKLCS